MFGLRISSNYKDIASKLVFIMALYIHIGVSWKIASLQLQIHQRKQKYGTAVQTFKKFDEVFLGDKYQNVK